MKPRTPLCEFALRLDQVHLGTEVVVFRQQDDGSFQPEMVGVFTTPWSPLVWPRDIAVQIRSTMPSFYGCMMYGSLGLGLRPKVALRGWCTHMTEADLEAGRFTTYEIHPGSRCPGLFYENTWSDRFVVKIKHAHRLLGCAPSHTRMLLRDMMYEMYIDNVEADQSALEYDRTQYGD